MTLPAVAAVRRAFPAAHITLLAKPWVIPVFEGSAHVDAIMAYDAGGRHRGVTGRFRLARDVGEKGFDAAILLQNAFEAAWIAWLARIPVRIGYDTDARRLLLTHPVRCTAALKRIHQTGYYPAMLRGAGLPAASGRPRMHLSRRRRAQARELLRAHGLSAEKTIVGINPSAAFGPAKQWFPERFAGLADRIAGATGAGIVIFGGPRDRDLGARIAGRMRHRPVDLCGRTTLAQAIALIGALNLFVTNDSGLMHIAAALDVPLIAIFGSTNPTATGPAGSGSRIIRSRMPCSPCLQPVCPEGHVNCMGAISVSRVFDAAMEML